MFQLRRLAGKGMWVRIQQLVGSIQEQAIVGVEGLVYKRGQKLLENSTTVDSCLGDTMLINKLDRNPAFQFSSYVRYRRYRYQFTPFPGQPQLTKGAEYAYPSG